MTLSIRIGNWLYRNAFPVYNRIYPLFKNIQDKREMELIGSLVKPGDTVVDIGANIGFYTRFLAQKVGPTGKVYAFEPDALNFKRLLQNTAGLTQVQAVQAAVSHENGVLKIYRSKMLNVDHRTYPVDGAESVEEIPAITLDSYLPSGLKPSFIKIDIQGYEYFAFQGMRDLIARSPQLFIISEFWPHALTRSGASADKMLQLLDELGLRIQVVQKNGLEELKAEQYLNLGKLEFLNLLLNKTQHEDKNG
ncbi:MAG: FkbM family methyltransferase [Flavobacteriales bacterium]